MAPEVKKTVEKLPTLYIPHGGGPCFFMEWSMGPPNTWDRMRAWLAGLAENLPPPKVLLVISAHWEETVVTVQSGAAPPLFFDYYGFPDHTYQLTWPARGAPDLVARIQGLLSEAGIPNKADRERGFDHGTFIPLKVAFPAAQIPALQLSLNANLDPATHLALGRALAPLRREGVLIIGSGMSFHNMRALMAPGSAFGASQRFDQWLVEACEGDPALRTSLLSAWEGAPEARFCHPREEHFLPLLVAAGAAEEEPGRNIFRDQVMGVQVSGFEFGGRAPDNGQGG